MRYMSILHTYKSYLSLNDRTPQLTLQVMLEGLRAA
jgi:hypothetical protein